MCWKNMPYWLKGGIITCGVYTLSAIIGSNCRDGVLCGILAIFTSFSVFPVVALLNLPSSFSAYFPWEVYALTGVLFFIIGALIGWIIGKIKARNEVKE